MATNKGFDCVSDLTSHGQQIKDARYEFVGRYTYSVERSIKDKLTRVEALHLSSMGTYLVNIFENAPTSAAYFTEDQGRQDAAAAYLYARLTLKQPVNTPIYFTVDYDASTEDIQHRIAAYFTGVRLNRGAYKVGVYGSGMVCRMLLEMGLVEYTCLAQSTGWAEYEQFKASGKWNLLQGPTISQFGLIVDPLESNGNGGGWRTT